MSNCYVKYPSTIIQLFNKKINSSWLNAPKKSSTDGELYNENLGLIIGIKSEAAYTYCGS